MLLRVADPPLTPSADEARTWLREELARPEYQRESILGRIWAWVQDVLARAADGAAGIGPLRLVVAMLVFAGLAVALVALVSRARLGRRAAPPARPVLDDPLLSAAELRRLAREAFSDERYDDAVVEGFRALTAGQIERRLLDDLPGTTAHEVAVVLEHAFPGRHDDLARAARLFDLVRYGDRRATREQAAAVLALDDSLAGAR